MNHELLIITTTNDDIRQILEDAIASAAYRKLNHAPPMVGPVYGANGVVTFILPPHGGAEDHDIFNDWRTARSLLLMALIPYDQKDGSLCVVDLDYAWNMDPEPKFYISAQQT